MIVNNILDIICLLLAICIPLWIKKKKGENQNFKLRDSAKILSIVIPYYFIVMVFYHANVNSIFTFIYYIVIRILFSFIIFLLVMKFSSKKINQIFSFSKLSNKIYLTSFYLYTSVMFVLSAYFNYSKSGFYFHKFIISKSIAQGNLLPILFLIITEIIAVTGEELVFRFFLINSLRQKISPKNAVILSSLIWMLTHEQINLTIFILGLFLGYLFIKYNSLLTCITIHFIYSLSLMTLPIYKFLNLSLVSYFMFLFIFQLLLFIVIEEILSKTKLIPKLS